ncbi:RNA polymerase sigma factor [Nonomuraea sp. NPDC048826]|uniref:RNA polymerase sigma factor n=1 Tax=Nonomuraea sp. NPDC048826 TaxID=3364347 RepID=UPI00371839CA
MDDDSPRSKPSLTATEIRLQATQAAFVDWFRQELPSVVGDMMRRGASLQDAQDAAQEAFLEAWRLCAGEPDVWRRVEHPRGWVRKVAERAWSRPPGERRRQVPATPFAVVPDHVPYGEDPADLAGPHVDLIRELKRLPPVQRQAMHYRLDRLPYAFIARELGVSEQRARDIVKKARLELAARLNTYRGGRPDE